MPVQTAAAATADPILASSPAAQRAPAAPPRQPDRQPDRPAAKGGRRVRLRMNELRRNRMITPDDMTSSIAQEFRSIKRKLLSAVRDQKSRSTINNLVMVTSALPSEGKTFTAMNLAISLAAERDLHVLLIDGDVIHQSLKGMFEFNEGDGLVELLKGKCRDASEVMHRCDDVPNLSVIFAGKADVSTPELMSSQRMAELCKELSLRYPDRIVIIDTPPVLASAEPAVIAAHVHHAIMVVAASQANRVQIQTAVENLSACRNVSFLFNKAPKWRQVEGDSYYQYYRGKAVAES
jgi:receptor protein-tyrosine kinase